MKEQLATRLEAPLRHRLRIYAAFNRRTLAEVISAALDGYLPSLDDLVRSAADAPNPGEPHTRVGGYFPDTALAECTPARPANGLI